MIDDRTACHLVEAAARALGAGAAAVDALLGDLPAAIYATDAGGRIRYFNAACIALAGREPRVGIDKWCVTWKLYTADGADLPHDECPMAVAVRERRVVRDAEAIAERPDGSRFRFVPYPTPLFDADGAFAGAVNLLRVVPGRRKRDRLIEQAERCRSLAAALQDLETAAALSAMATRYEEQALELTRSARAVLDGRRLEGDRGETLQ
jgi:PAS domain-containing protein